MNTSGTICVEVSLSRYIANLHRCNDVRRPNCNLLTNMNILRRSKSCPHLSIDELGYQEQQIMNRLERQKQQLIKMLGEERYNQLVKESEEQDSRERKTHRNLRGGCTGHTCGDLIHQPCDECEKAFPIQAIPLCSKSVHQESCFSVNKTPRQFDPQVVGTFLKMSDPSLGRFAYQYH
jgi:hypothetical protein